MRKRTGLLGTIWVAGVLLAGAGVTTALVAAGSGIFGPGVRPLTQAQVRQELAATGSVPASAAGAPGGQASAGSPGAAATGAPSARTFSGGTVFASCTAGQVMLMQRIPAQGYEIDGVSPGPGGSAWVRFKSGGTELVVTVTCAGNRPRFATSAEAPGADLEHGGGDRGGNGGGDDGGGGGSGRGGGGRGSSGGGGGGGG
jgi:hypothetical protein